MAYIITCAGTKNEPSISRSNMKDLSYPELNEARLELTNLFNLTLDWEHTAPAWHLYSGIGGVIYPRINRNNWTKPHARIKIVSALFGLIKHTDCIPYYNLMMTDRLPKSRLKVSDFWRDKNLLHKHINHSDIDLLSNNYRKAFNKNCVPIAVIPEVKWNDNYGFHKGRWLNEQLDNL